MKRLDRRRFVLSVTALLFGGGAENEAIADAAANRAFGALPRPGTSLWLRRADGEEIMTIFRTDSGYDQAQILALSWFMRDLADANHAVWMEPRLFDLLAGVQAGLSAAKGSHVPLIVTSGYRTAAHNAQIESAARNSMHLYGYAADIEAPGFSPRAIALAASFIGRGGIGLYDHFTHLDVWRTRTWFGPRPHLGQPGSPIPKA
ncbi:MAG: DUF882 domain-containing protein [Pseudomonadota bacterium]